MPNVNSWITFEGNFIIIVLVMKTQPLVEEDANYAPGYFTGLLFAIPMCQKLGIQNPISIGANNGSNERSPFPPSFQCVPPKLVAPSNIAIATLMPEPNPARKYLIS